jgi:hypothetical protein
MATDFSTLLGVGGFLFGIFAYFTSGILKDKKQLIEHEVEIKNLKDRVERLENEK